MKRCLTLLPPFGNAEIKLNKPIGDRFNCSLLSVRPTQTRPGGALHCAVLAKQYGTPRVKGSLSLDARRKAGFAEAELGSLEG